MKHYISSAEQLRCSVELAKRIYESGWLPDVIIGLYRGGVFPAIVIEDYLRSKGVKTFHFPLHIQSYDPDKAESTSKEVINFGFPDYVMQSYLSGNWKRVLVVDDICDTGKTFSAFEHSVVLNFYNLSKSYEFETRRATIAWKPEKHATFKPDWWIREFSNDTWVVFPHEFVGLTDQEVFCKKVIEQDDNVSFSP